MPAPNNVVSLPDRVLKWAEKRYTRVEKLTLIDWLSYVFPLISAITVFIGVRDLADGSLMGLMASSVAFLFEAAFYRNYLRKYPKASEKSRWRLLLLVPVFAVLALSLTTPFSAASFGGNAALREHFNQDIRLADGRSTELLASLYKEQALAPTLDQYATEFANLAKEESNGAFTGTAGHGDTAITFETISQSLAQMRDEVLANKAKIEVLKAADRQDIADLRAITFKPVSQREKVSLFAGRLNDVNDLFAQMQAASVAPSIAQADGVLNQVADLRVTDTSTPLGARQTVAIARAQQLVSKAQHDIDAAAATFKTNGTQLAPLTVMDEGSAIFVYWWEIKWAWAIALALDFAPLVFLFILAIDADDSSVKGRQKPKQEGLNARSI